MERILCVVLCLTFVFSFSSCKTAEPSQLSYSDGYDKGYDYGIKHAQKEIVDEVEANYDTISDVNLEDAISILSLYADGSYEKGLEEPVEEEQLRWAISLLLEQHDETEQLIKEIKDIEVY